MNQSERIAVESLDRIREWERERAEDRAAIREIVETLATGATYPKSWRIAWWKEKHAATIARATGQEGA